MPNKQSWGQHKIMKKQKNVQEAELLLQLQGMYYCPSFVQHCIRPRYVFCTSG